MRGLVLALGLSTMLAAMPVAAEEIPLQRNQPFLHAQTQLSFPVEIAGIHRTAATDYGTRQFDVAVNYGQSSEDQVVTIYLYRAGLADVSLMFPTVSEAILSRSRFSPVEAGAMVARPFTPPGSTSASGLRMAFATQGPGVSATGVALVQHGDWLMKVRVSVSEGGAGEVDALLDAALASFPLSGHDAQQQPAYVMQACTTPMDLAEAAPVDVAHDPAAMPTVLTTLITANTINANEYSVGYVPPTTVWCRNQQSLGQYPLFRPDERADAYVIALNDAGSVISAGLLDRTMRRIGSETPLRHPVILHDSNGTSVRALFMAPPAPEQLPAAINGRNSLGFTDRVSEIELDSALSGETTAS